MAETQSSLGHSDLHALVIDDELIQRRIIGRIFEQEGFCVEEAASFEAAEAKINDCKYHCITLDLSLKGPSGALLLRSIAARGGNAHIVVISGADEATLRAAVDIAQSLKLSAEFLAKPLKLPQMRSIFSRQRENGSLLVGAEAPTLN